MLPKYVAGGEQTLENLSKHLQPGDFIFWTQGNGRPAHVSHVGIYIGNDIMIHSSDIVRCLLLFPTVQMQMQRVIL